MLRKTCFVLLSLLFLNGSVTIGSDGRYNVLDFGAKPDGKTLCTNSIQKAIDRCVENGGGTVYFPGGTWLTGTIYLDNHVTLWLDSGCVLLGSKEKEDYGRPHRRHDTDGETFSCWAIVAGKDLQDIAIRGRGTIDGQGQNFKYKDGPRPKNIYLESCCDVLVEGVRLRSAGSWMQHYRRCNRVTIRDIAVFNHVSYNNDGLNIDSCRDVTISGCMVDSDDDAVVLKSLSLTPCENVSICDCVISSHCNSIKMGTESGGGFQNITVTNCTICSPRYSEVIYGRQRGLAGVALEIVDGGTLDRVTLSNLTIRGVTVPIFMRLGNRARRYEKDQSTPDIGTFRNVIVSDVVATDCSSIGCSITGLPDHAIENVTLSNIHLGFDGGGTREDASRQIPEKPTDYPESTMFGTLSAYGFFCRHVEGLRFHNLRLETAAPDHRHAVVFDDVNDAVLDGLEAAFASGAAGMVRCTNSQNVFIRNCRPPDGTELFLDLNGPRTKSIWLSSNNLSGVREVAHRAPDVPKSALVLAGEQSTSIYKKTALPPPDSNSTFRIDGDFPGGNIIVDRVEGDTVFLRPDQRDSSTWWFYWHFRVRGATGRTIQFHFADRSPIGTRGPAVSTDGGNTWSWLGPRAVQKSSFTYTFDAQSREVRFCFSIPYLEANLHCPYVSGEYNEVIYIVGSPHPAIWEQQQKFAAVLESVRAGGLPYSAKSSLPFGTAWNTAGNSGELKSCSRWGAEQPGVRLATTFEIPYANVGDAVVTIDNARAFGRDLGFALRHYLERTEE